MEMRMTEGSPLKLLLRFTMPIMAALVFQQLYNMADGLIVGRLLGVDAFAAVGCTANAMFLTLGTFEGLCAGFAIVTSTRFGAKDDLGVGKSYGAGMALTLILAAALAVGLSLAARPILHVMETPPEIFERAAAYLTVIYGGTPVVAVYSFFTNSMRAVGDSRTPLLLLVFACLLNIGLDYGFIALLKMGVAGAAYATIAAQLLAAAVCAIIIKKRFSLLKLSRETLSLKKEECRELLNMGTPMALQNTIVGAGSMIVQYGVNLLGVVAVAACTAGQKISSVIIQAVLTAFGMGMAPYTAQNVGAGRLDRVREGVKKCLAVALATALFFGAAVVFFGDALTVLFLGETDQEVVKRANEYLAYMGYTFWVLAALFVFRNALQGLGNGKIPMLSGMLELAGRAGATLVLQKLMGFTGICWATPLGWIIATIPLAFSYFWTVKRLEKAAALQKNLLKG